MRAIESGQASIQQAESPQFQSDESAAAYARRLACMDDVIALRRTDHVPLMYNSAFWHATYAGISFRTAMYDYEASAAAIKKTVLDLQPDAVVSPFPNVAVGRVLELAGFRPYQWPGHGLPDNRPYQYIDREYMTADEYDMFLAEPNWFLLTRYLPRVAEVYAPFAGMPGLAGLPNVRLMTRTHRFAHKDVADAFARLVETGEEVRTMAARDAVLSREIRAMGFPTPVAASCYAPYDYIADFLRGAKGIMLDLRRHRDKLLAAMDMVIPMMIEDAVATANANRGKVVFIALHWCMDGFMSPDQFKTFFWSPLRRVIMGLIEHGLVPMVFWEGDCTSKLEVIADVPRASCIYQFERSDMMRVKEVLGGQVCVRGGVPSSLLIAGTPDEVRQYCRTLIDKVGRDGGFILEGSSSIPYEARPENILAMYETAKETLRA